MRDAAVSLLMFIQLAFLLISCRSIVHGRHNVTVDDQDPLIIYTPAASWNLSAPSTLDAGGAHMLTVDKTATATLTFTGVAIYFMSPRWPYLVNTDVSLDSAPPVLIDLVDHSKPDVGIGPETVQSQVVWGIAGLPNQQHTIVIFVGAGQPYAVVDTLIYTVLDPEDLTTTTSSSRTSTMMSISSTIATTSGSTSSTPLGASPSTHVLPIALGTILGVLGLLIIALAVWFCHRRQKRPASEAWTVAGHSYPGSPQMTSTVTSPRSTIRTAIDDSFYANNPAYYSPTDGSGSPQYANINTTTAPRPRPPAGAFLPPQPSGTAIHDPNGGSQGYNLWAGAMPNPPQPPQPQPVRRSAAIVYQPNRLSTITEKSTPPIGGGSPLASSPASNQTEIYHDAEEGNSDFGPSLPNVNENRSGPSTQQPRLRRDPRDVTTRLQQGSASTGAVADGRAYPRRPPAYTPNL